MAESSRRKKPRIRKVPTVRQQIEDSTKKVETSKGKRWLSRPLYQAALAVIRVLKKILAPLAPVGRPLKRILGRLMPSYLVNAWGELRQVTWPNRRETWRLTGAVLIFAVVFGALVAAVDKGLDEIFKRVILK